MGILPETSYSIYLNNRLVGTAANFGAAVKAREDLWREIIVSKMLCTIRLIKNTDAAREASKQLDEILGQCNPGCCEPS